jgi:hypothetical protein
MAIHSLAILVLSTENLDTKQTKRGKYMDFALVFFWNIILKQFAVFSIMLLQGCIDLRLVLTLDQHLATLVTEVPSGMVNTFDSKGNRRSRKNARITSWSDACHVPTPFSTLNGHFAAYAPDVSHGQ